MAILGNTFIGAQTRGMDTNSRGIQVTATEASAPGISIWAYIEDTAPGEEWCAALIDPADDETVLAESAVRTNISTVGWYQFSGGGLASFALVNATVYKALVASESAAGANIYFDVGAGIAVANVGVNPLVLFSPLSTDARSYSLYIEYTPAGGMMRPRSGIGSGGMSRMSGGMG